jgi:hypothetical protein
MPPDVTSTACPQGERADRFRELARPRGAVLDASTVPVTPSTAPAVVVRPSTRCRNRSSTRPSATACRTRLTNGSSSAGPVPQTMWNRGTEFPCPSARWPPRSAQPTTGKKRTPSPCSQVRFSPHAKST